jgi:hypothetical protein
MIVTRGYGVGSAIVTRGYAGVVIDLIESILPQFITRRVSLSSIVQRVVMTKVVRREDD